MKNFGSRTSGLIFGLILSLFIVSKSSSQNYAYVPYTLFNQLDCDIVVSWTVVGGACLSCQTGGSNIPAGQSIQITSFSPCNSSTAACDIIIEVTDIGGTTLTPGTCVSTVGALAVFLNVTRYNVPTVAGCTSSGVSWTQWSNADWRIVPN